jgi:filamentous hemagglutinin
MREEGLIVGDGPLVRGNPNNLHLVNPDGTTARIGGNVDMAHKVDAVTWWNEVGRFHGAKAPEVRQFMLDSDNYILQLSGANRSAGAQLRQTYLPPAPPSFNNLKR